MTSGAFLIDFAVITKSSRRLGPLRWDVQGIQFAVLLASPVPTMLPILGPSNFDRPEQNPTFSHRDSKEKEWLMEKLGIYLAILA